LRFAPANLRLRGRALTLGDFAQLATQLAPEVAQARALPRPGGVRVIVAMRGKTPLPSRATLRELRRGLIASAAPALAADGALDVVPPVQVPLRISAAVTVARIEASGVVAKEVVQRILELLDPAVGGFDGSGWPFGQLPGETDIAAAISGTSDLDGIDAI